MLERIDVLSEVYAPTGSQKCRHPVQLAFGQPNKETNAHVVQEEAPKVRAQDVLGGGVAGAAAEQPSVPLPLLVSGRTEVALRAQAGRIAQYLVSHPELDLADVAFSLATRRTHCSHRAGVVADSRKTAASALRNLAEGEADEGTVQGRARDGQRVAFVFPGQGSQWAGMGQALHRQEHVFAEAFNACDAAFRPLLDWSLVKMLQASKEEQERAFARVDTVQPMLFAMALALAETWKAWGVRPHAVVGQSQGEIVAACLAGALPLEEAARVVAVRSGLLRELSGRGAMATVLLPAKVLANRLERWGERVSIAVFNSPGASVIAGRASCVGELLHELRAEGVHCRSVRAAAVDYASHSLEMDPILPALRDALGGLISHGPGVPMMSTVTGAWVKDGELNGEYWARNLREPVRFDRAIAALRQEGFAVFLEVSAHPLLIPHLREGLNDDEQAVVGSLRRDNNGRRQLLLSASQLHAHGVPVNWKAILGGRGGLVELPT